MTRDDLLKILKEAPVKTRGVNTILFGNSVYVRRLTPAEMVSLEYMMGENDGKPDNYRARYACLIACDENGKRLFRDEDAAVLGASSAATEAVERICEVGRDFNAEESEKALASAEKNSVAAPN